MTTKANITATELINVFETQLEHSLQGPAVEPIHQAIHYACLNGGKRLRPLLVYSAGLSFNATLAALHPAAVAVELIHCYSLVHDDLPCMDDDDLRRGKPTCHKHFNEALAVLAGGAMQALAFDVIACSNLDMNIKNRLTKTLSQAAGANGMVLGQALDLAAENQKISLKDLNMIHDHKTGKLITASILMGGLIAQCDANTLDALAQIGDLIGRAFQIKDDLLDLQADTLTLGKRAGADLAKHKATYPSIIGVTAAEGQLTQLYRQALEKLEALNLTSGLLEQVLAQMVMRSH